MKRSITHILFGLALVAFGIVAILDAANIIKDVNIWKLVWPSVLLLVGVEILYNSFRNILGYCFILLGGYFIAKQFIPNLSIGWEFLFPAILILIGLSVLLNFSLFSCRSNRGSAIFSGKVSDHFDSSFTGTDATAIFGGYEVDLRNHVFNNDVHLKALAVFGGVEIILPRNVNIVVKPLAILGGVDNKCDNSNTNSYTVYISATRSEEHTSELQSQA